MNAWVKICGIATEYDAAAAAAAGADAVGFVFAESPRRVSPADAVRIARTLPSRLDRVGVFVAPSYDEAARTVEAAELNVVQLHGPPNPALVERLRALGCRVAQAVRMRGEDDVAIALNVDADILLLDAFVPGRAGGTGRTFDWRLAAEVVQGLEQQRRRLPVVLAGGLTPENVTEAVRTARPQGVDVSSGVELAPGRKCPDKMRQFVRKVREIYGGF